MILKLKVGNMVLKIKDFVVQNVQLPGTALSKTQNANFSTESKSFTKELMKPKTGKRENLSVPGNYLA